LLPVPVNALGTSIERTIVAAEPHVDVECVDGTVVASAARALAVSVPGVNVTLANSTDARKKATGTGELIDAPLRKS